MILPADVPESVRRELRARQRAWPEDASLSEPELRAEIQAIFDTLGQLGDRVHGLLARLPWPPKDELEREVPSSLYDELRLSLERLAEEHFGGSLDPLVESLAATPASLRADWLK